MTCTTCAMSVEKSLKKAGASAIAVDPLSGEVQFEILSGDNVNTYFDAINNSGFEVQEVDDEDTSHVQSSVPMSLWLITLVTVPLLLHMFFTWPVLHNPYVQWVLSSIVLYYGIKDMGKKALQSIRNRMPSMDVLVMVGSIAAYVYSLIGMIFYPEDVHDYLFFETSAMIIVLVSWGHYLEERTVSSTTKAIRDLISLKPKTVSLVLKDSLGNEMMQQVAVSDLRVGDTLLLREGERIGADGLVESGELFTDERLLTGEPLPVQKSIGDQVFEGTTVEQGNARIQVTKIGKDSALSKIIALVKSARTEKPKMQKLADRISAVFVPLVIVIAIMTFFVNWMVAGQSVAESLMRSIAVLVISCPCAMGIATPAAVMVGLGRGSKMGILIRNGLVLEKLADIKTFIFDKTGTLTEGSQQVKVHKFDENRSLSEVHNILYTLETYSTHPIAQSIVNHSPEATLYPWEVVEHKGKGMQADVDGHIFRLGSPAWLSEATRQDIAEHGDIYLMENDRLIASISLQESISKGARECIDSLQKSGYQVVILSGDEVSRVQAVAQHLGITDYHGTQSPEEKLEKIKMYQKSGSVCMVGDGINDAPALSIADISVSMSHASDIAQNSADVILLGSDLQQMTKMLRLSKATFNTIKGNLFWAFFYNVIAIPVAAAGLLSPTWGAGVMALSDVFLVLNSLRLRYKNLDV